MRSFEVYNIDVAQKLRNLIFSFNKTEDPSVPAAGIGYLNGNTEKKNAE